MGKHRFGFVFGKFTSLIPGGLGSTTSEFTESLSKTLEEIEHLIPSDKGARLQEFATEVRDQDGRFLGDRDITFGLPLFKTKAHRHKELYNKLSGINRTTKKFMANHRGGGTCVKPDQIDTDNKAVADYRFLRTDNFLWRSYWKDEFYQKDHTCADSLDRVGTGQKMFDTAKRHLKSLGGAKSLGTTRSRFDKNIQAVEKQISMLKDCKNKVNGFRNAFDSQR